MLIAANCLEWKYLDSAVKMTAGTLLGKAHAEVEKIKAMGFSDERIEGMRRSAQREIERFGG